jgi:4-amino-4-deoxy-L-arabinose transferase-like glycosyltransferase
VPRPLTLLLVAVAVLGVSWALLVPPGQAPDEPAHVGYAQVLAEDFRLPDEKPGRTFSREQELAQAYANVDQTAQILLTKPEWSELAYEDWLLAEAALPDSSRGEGGHYGPFRGPNPARTNPPLYYLWESISYRAASGGDFFDRLYAMRLWSVLLLLVSTAATWLLIGELTNRRRTLQLTGATLVGLQPMAVFVTSSVNPDAALIACFSLAFWLGARVLLRGLTLRDGVALSAVAALAVLTKGTGYALVPGVAIALGVGFWRLRPWRRSAWVAAGASGLALVVPVVAWLGLARALDRAAVNRVPGSGGGSASAGVSLLDYLWQFYLPKLPFQGAVPAIPKLPAYDIWIKTGWGAFGWLEVRFPNAVYVVLALVTVVLLAGGAAVLARRRRRSDLPVAAFFAAITFALLAGLHWIELRTIRTQGVIFNQGRYLLPLLPLLGVAAAASLTLLPAARRALAAGLLIGGAFVLQAFSLALIVGRFYA